AQHELLSVLSSELMDRLPARSAAEPTVRATVLLLRRPTPLAWCQGSNQELVWECLNEAKADILHVPGQANSRERLSAHSHDVLRKAHQTLADADPPLVSANVGSAVLWQQ